MEVGVGFDENDYLSCCGSTKFAKEMAAASPFPSYHRALTVAKHIWFNIVDVNGWLQAFSAHPSIGQPRPPSHASATSAEFSFHSLTQTLLFHLGLFLFCLLM